MRSYYDFDAWSPLCPVLCQVCSLSTHIEFRVAAVNIHTRAHKEVELKKLCVGLHTHV